MRVRILRFLGREACACALGGLAYDDGAPAVVNLLHLYTFLLFFITPYALASAFEGTAYSTALLAYTAVGGSFFAALKVGNHVLHQLLTKSRDEPADPGSTSHGANRAGAEPPTEGPTLEQLHRIRTERRLTHEFDGLLREAFEPSTLPQSAVPAATLQPVRSHRRLLRPAPAEGQEAPSPTSPRVGSPGQTPRQSPRPDHGAGGRGSIAQGADMSECELAEKQRSRSWCDGGAERHNHVGDDGVEEAEMAVRIRRTSEPVGRDRQAAEGRVGTGVRQGLDYRGGREEAEEAVGAAAELVKGEADVVGEGSSGERCQQAAEGGREEGDGEEEGERKDGLPGVAEGGEGGEGAKAETEVLEGGGGQSVDGGGGAGAHPKEEGFRGVGEGSAAAVGGEDTEAGQVCKGMWEEEEAASGRSAGAALGAGDIEMTLMGDVRQQREAVGEAARGAGEEEERSALAASASGEEEETDGGESKEVASRPREEVQEERGAAADGQGPDGDGRNDELGGGGGGSEHGVVVEAAVTGKRFGHGAEEGEAGQEAVRQRGREGEGEGEGERDREGGDAGVLPEERSRGGGGGGAAGGAGDEDEEREGGATESVGREETGECKGPREGGGERDSVDEAAAATATATGREEEAGIAGGSGEAHGRCGDGSKGGPESTTAAVPKPRPDEVEETTCVAPAESEEVSVEGSGGESPKEEVAKRRGGDDSSEAKEEVAKRRGGDDSSEAKEDGREVAAQVAEEGAGERGSCGGAGGEPAEAERRRWEGAAREGQAGEMESDRDEEVEKEVGGEEGGGTNGRDGEERTAAGSSSAEDDGGSGEGEEGGGEDEREDGDCSGSLIEGVTVNARGGDGDAWGKETGGGSGRGAEGRGFRDGASTSSCSEGEEGWTGGDLLEEEGGEDRGEGEQGGQSMDSTDVLLNLSLDEGNLGLGAEGLPFGQADPAHGHMQPGAGDMALHTYIDENGEVQQYMFYSEEHLRSIGLAPGSDMSDLLNVLGNVDPVDPFGGGMMRPLARRLRTGLRRGYLANLPPRPTKTRIEWNFLGRPRSYVLPFDRHLLESFLDRSLSWTTVLYTLVCWVAVGATAAAAHSLYDGPSTLVMWLVAAAAQNSLLKSPQPDAASVSAVDPATAYIRAFLFCVVGSLALLFDAATTSSTHPDPRPIYGVTVDTASLASLLRDLSAMLLLCSPAIHLLGLVPTISTVVHHVLEQVHMFAFGGSGTPSLEAAILAVSSECAVGFGVWSLAAAGFRAGGEVQSGGVESGLALGLAVAWCVIASHCPLDLRYWALLLTGGDDLAPPTHRDRAEARMLLSGRAFRRRCAEQLLLAMLLGVVFGCIQGFALLSATGKGWEFGVNALAIVIAVLWLPAEYIIPPLRYAQACLIFKAPLIKPSKLPPAPGTDPILPQLPRSTMEWCWQSVDFAVAFLLHPLLVTALATEAQAALRAKFGAGLGSFLWTLAVFKLTRSAMQGGTFRAAPLAAALLLFRFDLRGRSETMLVDYLVVSVAAAKLQDLKLKVSFAVTYAAPWNVPWGSAVHAVLQPLGLPHAVCFLAQAAVAAVLGAPVLPVAGAALFQMGAPRPIKFWQKKFQSTLADPGGAGDGGGSAATGEAGGQSSEAGGVERLDAVLYEHVTVALRRWLAGHIAAGRLGVVRAGGVYLLLSDSLTCMLHVIEVGRGHVTFQVRGLELKGTYCQEREVEAVKEDGNWGGGTELPLCWPGAGSEELGGGLLPLEGAAELRWNAWKVVSTGLPLATYNANMNPAGSLFASFMSKAVLIRNLVKAVILHLVRSERLAEWMGSAAAAEALVGVPGMVAKSDGFHGSMNDDYEAFAGGITVQSFLSWYRTWILYCLNKRRLRTGEGGGASGDVCEEDVEIGIGAGAGEGGVAERVVSEGGESPRVGVKRVPEGESGGEGGEGASSEGHGGAAGGLETDKVYHMCFLVTTAVRRALLPSRSAAWDGFLQELHALLSGRFKAAVVEDEWIFSEQSIVQEVLWPSVRAALKLQVDFVQNAEEAEGNAEVYDSIAGCGDGLVIEAESAPRWRQELLRGAPQLLSLRQQREEDSASAVLKHSLLQLELRYLHFRVVEINPEAVRGLWAGQLHELVFLGNQNRERGSIQQMKPILRNLINQSLDPPAGYPIYVSPLVTSLLI